MSLSRRRSLRVMGGAAMVPLLALGWPRLALGAQASFEPPAAPMRLSRTLVRDLPGGAEIMVRRRWMVEFRPSADGFTLSGQQTSVEVETPPTLGFLAQLEEKRIEAGLFPMALSPGGMIVTGDQAPDSEMPDSEMPDSEMFDRAILAAARHIDHAGLPADDARQAIEALSALQKSAANLTSKVPRDLFRPLRPHWQVDRNIDLPNGRSGGIAVIFDARMDAAGQLMEQYERRVVSSIGSSSRTSSELWELARI